MLSIPGVGASSTAVILSEYDDFGKFKGTADFIGVCGLAIEIFVWRVTKSAGILTDFKLFLQSPGGNFVVKTHARIKSVVPKNSSKMLAFAGLEPGYFQSGQSESTGHMVKHGSPHLRCALLNCCLPLVSNEPVFAEFYAKKRAEGKTHQVAMTHVAKKLLRVIYTLQTKNIPYDPALIR